MDMECACCCSTSRSARSTRAAGDFSVPGAAALVRLRDEANVPMVYASHDVAELRQLATQIVMPKQGRVTSFGGVKVLTQAP